MPLGARSPKSLLDKTGPYTGVLEWETTRNRAGKLQITLKKKKKHTPFSNANKSSVKSNTAASVTETNV